MNKYIKPQNSLLMSLIFLNLLMLVAVSQAVAEPANQSASGNAAKPLKATPINMSLIRNRGKSQQYKPSSALPVVQSRNTNSATRAGSPPVHTYGGKVLPHPGGDGTKKWKVDKVTKAERIKKRKQIAKGERLYKRAIIKKKDPFADVITGQEKVKNKKQ